MTVKFYNYTGEANVISKTLPTSTDITGDKMTANQNIDAPVVYITSSSAPTYNYAYIADYGRYYFVEPGVWISSNVWEMRMQLDPLMSYATQIKNQSGIVRYSVLGSMGMADPRISYETKKRVTTSTVAIANQYQTGWYVIRYYNVYIPGSGLAIPKTFCAAFMNETSWQAFLSAYAALQDDERVVVGNCIIDVSYVRYLNSSALANLTTVQKLDFAAQVDPNTIGAGVATVTLSADMSRVAYVCQNHENAATLGSLTFDISTSNIGAYWELDAERNVYIPFVGDISFKLSDLGINPATISTVGVRIAYEPYENAYILMIGPKVSAGNYNMLQPTLKIIKVAASVPFRADNNFTNMGLLRMQMATTAAGAVIGVGMGNPMGLLALPQAIGQYTQAKLSEATGYKMTGTPGGDPAFSTMVDAQNLTITVISAIPRDNYTTLWVSKGMPDGAWRAFSTLSGYAEIELCTMAGFNATVQVQDQIRRLLSEGAYF